MGWYFYVENSHPTPPAWNLLFQQGLIGKSLGVLDTCPNVCAMFLVTSVAPHLCVGVG